MKARSEIDGSITLTTEDGRRFVAIEDQGEITLHSVDGPMMLKPVSDHAVIIDTPEF